MSVSQTAPSPFAALLRRSKFASYDPCIGQVYTTHGGHAHRGNWGLKRPLPNRRRVGFVTVRSVDSPEQQTEWNSAESSARWLRRWEELGKKLEVEELGNWSRNRSYAWSIDTEFDRAGKVGMEPGRERQREQEISNPSNLIPDPETMSPKQFQKYLARLRALRPEFKKYLEERWHEQQAQATAKANDYAPKLKSEKMSGILKMTGSGEIDMYASAQNASNLHVEDFLMRQAARELYSPESKRIARRPHNFAGLEYTFMSSLQSQYLHKPAPGRDVAQSRAERFEKALREKKTDVIAVGGIIGELKGYGAQTIMPTDFGTQEAPRRNREQGKGTFTMSKVRLSNVPSTVGHVPQKADDAKFLSIQFRTHELAKANSSNPYPLGSLDYVGWEDMNRRKGGAALIPGDYNRYVQAAKLYRLDTGPKRQGDGKALVGTLNTLINQKKS